MDQIEKKQKKWYLRWWMIVIYVVLGLSVIGSLGSSPDSVSSGPAQAPAPEPVITVTALKLATAYKDNQVAADLEYKDKLVEITGTIDGIGKDILEDSYVTFEADQYAIINKVQAYFTKANEGQLVNLKKGQKITLRGRVEGGTFNIVVRDSEIIN